jgi:hypothetical protein
MFSKPKIYFLFVKDTVILYNIALILQKLASQLLRDEKSTLEEVLQVCNRKHLFRNRGCDNTVKVLTSITFSTLSQFPPKKL